MLIELVGARFGRLIVLASGGSQQTEGQLDGSASAIAALTCMCRCMALTQRSITIIVAVYSARKQLSAVTKHGRSRSSSELLFLAGDAATLLQAIRHKLRVLRRRGIGFASAGLSFGNFYADMGIRPEGCSLDRINVNDDYGPDNCRWADAKQQSHNRRPSKQRKRRRSNLADIQAYAESLTRAGARP